MSIISKKLKLTSTVLAGVAPVLTTTVSADEQVTPVVETEVKATNVETPATKTETLTVEQYRDQIITTVTNQIKESKATTVAEVSSDVTAYIDTAIKNLKVDDDLRKEITTAVYDKIEEYSTTDTDNDFMKALSDKITSVSTVPAEKPIENVPAVVEPLVDGDNTIQADVNTQAQTVKKTGVNVYTTQKEIDAKKGTYYYNKAKVKGTSVQLDEAEAKSIGLSHSLLDDQKAPETPKAEEKPNVADAKVASAGPGVTISRPKQPEQKTTEAPKTEEKPAQSTGGSEVQAKQPTGGSEAQAQQPTGGSEAQAQPSALSTRSSLPETGEHDSVMASFAGLITIATAAVLLKKRKETEI